MMIQSNKLGIYVEKHFNLGLTMDGVIERIANDSGQTSSQLNKLPRTAFNRLLDNLQWIYRQNGSDWLRK